MEILVPFWKKILKEKWSNLMKSCIYSLYFIINSILNFYSFEICNTAAIWYTVVFIMNVFICAHFNKHFSSTYRNQILILSKLMFVSYRKFISHYYYYWSSLNSYQTWAFSRHTKWLSIKLSFKMALKRCSVSTFHLLHNIVGNCFLFAICKVLIPRIFLRS